MPFTQLFLCNDELKRIILNEPLIFSNVPVVPNQLCVTTWQSLQKER